eukprot:g75817.t1
MARAKPQCIRSPSTPGMLAYGACKAAVHQIALSLACSGSGLPPDSSVLTLLPNVIDTPTNRVAMPAQG